MRASRVRPGALVRDDAGQLQVVVKLRHIGSDLMTTYATFASGREEEWGPSADVEVVRLTSAQTTLMYAAAIRDGLEVEVDAEGVPCGFVHTDGWPRHGWERRVFTAVERLGLVAIGKREYGRYVKTRRAKPTELGRAYLDAMKEKAGG